MFFDKEKLEESGTIEWSDIKNELKWAVGIYKQGFYGGYVLNDGISLVDILMIPFKILLVLLTIAIFTMENIMKFISCIKIITIKK